MVTPAPNPPALPDDWLQKIAARGGSRRYPAGAVLITEDDDGDSLYIVVSGRVKVYAANPAGKEVIINVHGPGEYVGELALDGRGRSASVVTLEPTVCVVVTGANLRAFIGEHPDFAMHLILNLIGRLRGLTGNVKSIALEDVYGRVVNLLDKLAVPCGAERVVEQRLTQQDIAEWVGSSREMISRIFKDLTVGGYLRVDAGRIRVLKALPAAW